MRPPPDRRAPWEPLGLVAVMCAALGRSLARPARPLRRRGATRAAPRLGASSPPRPASGGHTGSRTVPPQRTPSRRWAAPPAPVTPRPSQPSPPLPQPCRPPPGRTGRSSPHRAPGTGATRGQPRAARGVRFRHEPHGLAASRSRQTPERIMALLRVLTGCWLVSAALQDRIRQALKDQATTVANPPGHPGQHPTARGIFHDGAGVHRLLLPGPWPQVVKLPEGPQHLLQRRGTP